MVCIIRSRNTPAAQAIKLVSSVVVYIAVLTGELTDGIRDIGGSKPPVKPVLTITNLTVLNTVEYGVWGFEVCFRGV